MKRKIIIYQVFTRLFGNINDHCVKNGTLSQNGSGKMNDFTPEVLKSIREDGYTHVWFTGLIEHATQTDYTRFGIRADHPAVVKGKAGSPYAIKDYYDVDPDLAVDVPNRMREFEQLVRRTHDAGLGFIMDFVPNHVARQYQSDAKPEGVSDLGENDNTNLAFSPQNNFYYISGQPLRTYFDHDRAAPSPYREYPAKATGNDCFSATPADTDWYETVKLNYGVDYCGGRRKHFEPTPDTWTKMRDILLFWAGKHVDGFRCDMAEMVPVEFWAWCIPQVKNRYPDVVFIAEVYNPSEYRNYLYTGHFDYLYDKVGLYDTLRGVMCGYRSAAEITHCWQSVDDIRDRMLNFLENHDEQRIASDFFAADARKAIPALIVSACMGKNPFMVYAGQEYGERGMDEEGFSGRDGRTTIFDYWSVASLRRALTSKLTPEERQLHRTYARILNLCNTEDSLRDGAFFDLMYVNNDGCTGFNPNCHYAFLRHVAHELVLVACNFSSQGAQVGVRLPQHAFDTLSLREGMYWANDLLSGEAVTVNLRPDSVVSLLLPAYGASMLKVRR
mgnify:CR=1 FL=1